MYDCKSVYVFIDMPVLRFSTCLLYDSVSYVTSRVAVFIDVYVIANLDTKSWALVRGCPRKRLTIAYAASWTLK